MSESDQTGKLRLKLSLGDHTIEAEGPPDDVISWVDEMQERYFGGSGTAEMDLDTESGDEGIDVDSKYPDRTLGEFYRMADEVNNHISKGDAALLTGWYLEKIEGQDNFTKSEVEAKANSAGLTLGANPSRDLSRNASAEKANLNAVETRDGESAYTLTLTGEDYVEEELLDLRS